MQFIEAIILGIVQGLTEFLPISSSAHLRIVGEFLPSAEDPGATFTAITQIGTELAVLVYFWNRIVRIIAAWAKSLTGRIPRNDPDARMGWIVIIGTLPIGVLGFLFQDVIRDTFRNLWLVAIVLIVFGVILGVADALGRRVRTEKDLTMGHGLTLGFAQALALIPGVSRSGATTTAGLALGYTRPAAAEVAFLLAVPAVFGSGLYELVQAIREPGESVFSLGETAVATVVSFGVGLAVIAYLMRYLKKGSFLPFVVYRVVLGAVLIVLLATGALQAY
ncbi:undecaprenyl-diphosphate phosphatase [Microbacterium sp. EYE_5]|uniref:undecaprenyl-diphosphate phosphatase n=1 Tax=unclassified Microbacterium TaxID=2609290 RepID=UPI00200538D9|nr:MULTISPECIES: undecaprenyl-diphosphate phosphatase [unclassified Microbacterium]MCK6080545.1 undecaprenyl-diphosphate phosphatase [Microbacterium sp. EYE_382]MCK6085816.1 undecaprenyl-diphosphate phosphatase [Microbacterium sp. EYE_384]MCK6124686.1 undecaprenyl-diphosphate phosphatase [Microbacterium sp. EYE_80]MCK6127595.1 undecaprenyl-diphosphate phosphatase [Microbacterium sp. EYE_79]MCK6141500.1 undecaprenyl-diphosphate phosphatase [Microbacterium sp. EYE_39]